MKETESLLWSGGFWFGEREEIGRKGAEEGTGKGTLRCH